MHLKHTHTLDVPNADLVYDVRGPLPPSGGRPALLMIGQPMTADGFDALAAHFTDRTVVTYDPRGLGRSIRRDGRSDHTPQQQAADLHLLIEALGAGPVEVFASSGGAVTALELVATYPGDVVTLVAHEPPINAVLPDAVAAERARAGFHEAYQARGTGAGMAAFIAMTSWQGEFTDDYFGRPAPEPAMFGLSTDDDGSRDDPLLSKSSWAISDYRPDAGVLTSTPTRIVIAVGEESGDTYTARTAVGTAASLGQEAVVFPSHHGGFLGGQFGYAGKPEEFAARLREVLDAG
ncbi:alpha/beta fold hydrolase [Plantactinospora sp. CA-294935]|uniref:alpha/beta fold hydrolase n=1 Tax=Plantactinospora sp. CA-294935 TaxID=3240012 RepID=UPI003D8A75D4